VYSWNAATPSTAASLVKQWKTLSTNIVSSYIKTGTTKLLSGEMQTSPGGTELSLLLSETIQTISNATATLQAVGTVTSGSVSSVMAQVLAAIGNGPALPPNKPTPPVVTPPNTRTG